MLKDTLKWSDLLGRLLSETVKSEISTGLYVQSKSPLVWVGTINQLFFRVIDLVVMCKSSISPHVWVGTINKLFFRVIVQSKSSISPLVWVGTINKLFFRVIDLGVMCPLEKILSTAIEQNADIIGVSGNNIIPFCTCELYESHAIMLFGEMNYWSNHQVNKVLIISISEK